VHENTFHPIVGGAGYVGSFSTLGSVEKTFA